MELNTRVAEELDWLRGLRNAFLGAFSDFVAEFDLTAHGMLGESGITVAGVKDHCC